MSELQVKFYLGQNEDCILGDSTSESSERLLQRGNGGKSLSRVWLFATPWVVACKPPLSMEFSRPEYWSEQPFPSPGDLPNPGIEPRFPSLQVDSLPPELPGKPKNTGEGQYIGFWWRGGSMQSSAYFTKGFPLSADVNMKGFSIFLDMRSREGNGIPLQYSCLENPMDGGAW